MRVELYLWEGKWGPFRIKSKCRECDINTAIFKSLKQEFSDRMELVIEPWLDNWPKLFFKYFAWHAPIVIVDDKLYVQGVVVEIDDLKERILRAK